jgi:GT2 family glycosyltransferase
MAASPRLSVIVLNYNGAAWLERCLQSLAAQTIFPQIEIIVADNASPDGSDKLAASLMAAWVNGRVLQHGKNLGFSDGNNLAAKTAAGEFLLFLNNDTWMDPECLERLLSGVMTAGVSAACPLILEYDSDEIQSMGAAGFDIFGLATERRFPAGSVPAPILMPEGCAYLISREKFFEVGGFDPKFFMYAEEYDLSWRVWLSGGSAALIPAARLHHRGAAQVNPQGGGKVAELRTSDAKRFYANRNSLLSVLKNARGPLLLLVLLQVMLLAVEMLAALMLVRRWSFIRKAYVEALADCWRMRRHLHAGRRQIANFRKRGDFFMLRFLRLRPNRWDELQRIKALGIPKVSPAAK